MGRGGGLAIWEPPSKDLGVVETTPIWSLGGGRPPPMGHGVACHPKSIQLDPPPPPNVQRDGYGHPQFLFLFLFLFF